MPSIITNYIAVFSSIAFIILWFWVARRELRIKRSMLESARVQLLIIREQCALTQDDIDENGVVARSVDIYNQSMERYNETLKKLWFFIPGRIMGFRKVEDRGVDQ